MKTLFYSLILIAIYACTTDTTSKNPSVESEILNTFTNTRIKNFEESLIKALSLTSTKNDFEEVLKTDLIKKENLLTKDFSRKLSKISSAYNPENDTILNIKILELKDRIISFEPNESDNDDIIKEKFLSYMNNEKEVFIQTINSQDDLTDIQKDILINQATYELGIITVLSEHSEELHKLGNVQYNVNNQLKVSNDCNWWCRNRKAILCSGMSLGAAGCWVSVVYGCVPCVDICAGLTVLSVLCWTNG
jgi:hypothetical protein